uniref:perilipin-3-like n=1 Tax=Pristiophorus japonicus TaxID=55135 RepID=UPI00398F3E9F
MSVLISLQIAAHVREMAIRKLKDMRDKVTSPILHVSDKAINVVTYRMEKTKGLVDESVTSVLSSGFGRLITDGVDGALSRSEQLVDSCLPNEDGSGTADEDLPCEEAISPSNPPHRSYKRMYSLASKLYSHAYKRVVIFIQNAKEQRQEIVALVPDVCLMRPLTKEGLDIASSNSNVQMGIIRSLLSWHTNNTEGEQKEGGIVESAAPGLRKNFQIVFSDIVANLNDVSNVVQMKKQQTLKTVQRFYSQFWSMNLLISPSHFVSQLKGKLWVAWNTLYVKKDDVLSGFFNILLLPGGIYMNDKTDFETEENQNRGWSFLKPRPPKEKATAQISDRMPESQGREAESIPSENSISVPATETKGGLCAGSSSGQSEKEGQCPEPEVPGQWLQNDLEQLSTQAPIFQEQQVIGEDFRESELRCPIPF